MADTEKYDSALLAIIQSEGKIAPFLDVIMGFLYRRTDFFHIMESNTDRLGFAPGVAQKLILNVFKKYEALSQHNLMRQKEAQKTKKENDDTSTCKDKQKNEKSHNSPEVPAAEHQDERGREELVIGSQSSPLSTEVNSEKQENQIKTKSPADPEKQIKETNQQSKPPSDVNNDEEEEDPEKARERRQLQANPLTYNGADREHYMWSQIITETDVRVKVPDHIVKGKQVKVDIKKKHIKVSYLQKDNSWYEVLNSDLIWEINVEESMWTLDPKLFIHINLEKREERWWEAVFVNEPKVNTRKIDCSRPMTDLDDEAQTKIEEMMYNQRQKQLGLPQSHEQKTHDMLRKAWDAEGSPFKGQPFDPSRFSVDSSGIANINPS